MSGSNPTPDPTKIIAPPIISGNAPGNTSPSTSGTGNIPPSGTPSTDTPASIGLPTNILNQAQGAVNAASGGYYDANGNPQGAPTYQDTYNNTINGFQTEIDNLEKSKAQARTNLTSAYAPIAANDLGSEVALNARRGLGGSDFGLANINKTQTTDQDNLQNKIAASDDTFQTKEDDLYSQARTLAEQQYESKTAAYGTGAKNALDWITTGKPTLQTKQTTDYVTQAINNGTDLTDPKFAAALKQAASSIGVTSDQLLSAYKTQKQTLQDAADAKAKANQLTLAEGEKVYARNTDGTYSVVAQGDPKAVSTTTQELLQPDGTTHTFLINSQTGEQIKDLGMSKDSQGNDVPIPLDPAVTAKFLQGKSDSQVSAFNSLPSDQQATVMQLVNGDALLSDVTSKYGTAGQANLKKIIAAATAVDPTFSVNSNKQKNQYKLQFNDPNGKSQVQLGAANTALGHLANLKTEITALQGDRNFQGANNVKDYIANNINGSNASTIAKFDQDAEQLATELAKFYSGGTAPDAASIQAQRNIIDRLKPTNVLSALVDNDVSLLTSKISTTGEQYKNVIGDYPDNPLIDPDVLQNLKAAGIDTTDLTTKLIQQGMPATTIKDYIAAFPNQKDTAQQLAKLHPEYSEQDALQVLQGFNTVGSDTNSGSEQVKGFTETVPAIPTIDVSQYNDLQKRNLAFAPKDAPNIQVSIGAGAAVKNNNPGNLRNTDGSWQQFATPEDGFKALMGYVARAKSGDQKSYNPGQTLYQFFAHYAPSSDNNDPKGYAQDIAKRLGVNPLATIGTLPTFDFARAIALHESGTKIKTIG